MYPLTDFLEHILDLSQYATTHAVAVPARIAIAQISAWKAPIGSIQTVVRTTIPKTCTVIQGRPPTMQSVEAEVGLPRCVSL